MFQRSVIPKPIATIARPIVSRATEPACVVGCRKRSGGSIEHEAVLHLWRSVRPGPTPHLPACVLLRALQGRLSAGAQPRVPYSTMAFRISGPMDEIRLTAAGVASADAKPSVRRCRPRARKLEARKANEGDLVAMEMFMLRANEYTDEDLLKVLDRPFWLARAGSVGLGLPGTLRKALCRAHAASGGDGFNGSIVKLASD